MNGYFPEQTKSILVVYPRNFLWVEAFFQCYGLQIMTGSRYLGEFVGLKAAQNCWMGVTVEGWWN